MKSHFQEYLVNDGQVIGLNISSGEVDYAIELMPIDYFQPSEAVDPAAVVSLSRSISRSGIWSTALPVEAETGYVMDGNHRLEVGRELGLRMLPCIRLHYLDVRVSVSEWKSGKPFDRLELMRLARTGRILPYKTTRHQFAPTLPSIRIDLSKLTSDVCGD